MIASGIVAIDRGRLAGISFSLTHFRQRRSCSFLVGITHGALHLVDVVASLSAIVAAAWRVVCASSSAPQRSLEVPTPLIDGSAVSRHGVHRSGTDGNVDVEEGDEMDRKLPAVIAGRPVLRGQHVLKQP